MAFENPELSSHIWTRFQNPDNRTLWSLLKGTGRLSLLLFVPEPNSILHFSHFNLKFFSFSLDELGYAISWGGGFKYHRNAENCNSQNISLSFSGMALFGPLNDISDKWAGNLFVFTRFLREGVIDRSKLSSDQAIVKLFFSSLGLCYLDSR